MRYDLDVRVVSMLFVLSGCQVIWPLEPPETHRRTITLTQPSAETHAEFPVSIVLVDDADLRATARANGSDIRFVDAGGVELASEVAYADGTLDAWVKVPELPPDPVEIVLEYGGPSRTSTPEATWQQHFFGVWHLSETVGVARDSGPQGINVSGVGAADPGGAPGIVGGARMFDGDDAMCAISAQDVVFDGSTSFGLDLWYLAAKPTANALQPLHKGGGTVEPGFLIQLDAQDIVAQIGDGTRAVTATSQVIADQWVHVHVNVRRDLVQPQLELFVNGARRGMTDIPSEVGSLVTTEKLCLGAPSAFYEGLLDEVRIYNGIQSDDYIAAIYANLAQRDQFVTIAMPR